MKTSITIATFLVLSAGAASAGAIVSPYQGSDTLFNVTTDAIAKAGFTPANAYVGGGSGNGETAMLNGTQVTAPMSRMMNNSVCAANTTNAAGVVIGLDAVDVLSSTASGASASCNSAGEGLIASGGASNFANWKGVLKLVYGGEPNPADSSHFMCNGPLRTALVANWSNLFANGCANGAAACGTAPQSGQLWHAFRRDEASGTSDVFSSLIGISPSTSVSKNNGFGASPYCNSLNWDTSTANAACALGKNKQFVGPGGVADAAAADSGLHRTPPPGTWGTTPISGSPNDADVLPTDMQDNDPIRRTCLGATLGTTRQAEDVCNLDGALGLVLSVPATDFIVGTTGPSGEALFQYPIGDVTGGACPASGPCTTYVGCGGNSVQVSAPSIFTCAPSNTRKHSGQCPDGDSGLFGGGCLTKAAGTSTGIGTGTQCLAAKGQIPTIAVTGTVTTDGRVQNMFMFDGANGGGGYIQQKIPTATGVLSLDGAIGIGRIHSVSIVPGSATPTHTCQLKDATDEIGCLVQADPCSIGFAGDGGRTWGQRNPGGSVASNNGALLVDGVAPSTATVQQLGKSGEYELSRKLYFNSIPGFAAVSTAADVDEFTLGKDEATPSFINPILTNDGFFTLGPNTPPGVGTDTQFCEDFNQLLICPTQNTTNDNACNRNPAGIPGDPSAVAAQATVSTVCGNGNIDAFEECDPTAAVQPPSGCSTTCRCVGAFVNGACN